MNTSGAHRYLDVGSRGTAARGRRRSRAIRVGGPYDKFVQAMRIVLPIAAFILAAVTIGWPLLEPKESSFVLARERVDISPERLRMEKPRYFGADNDGRPFVIQADSALQEKGETELVSLTGIEARMTMKDGTELVSDANRGVFMQSAKRLALIGDVVVRASNGYVIRAADAELDLSSHKVISNRPITGEGPLGEFKAASFEGDIDQDKVIFKDGVTAHITPARDHQPAAGMPAAGAPEQTDKTPENGQGRQ